MDALPRRTGRPLSFDRDVALQQAMLAFWRHGYESTSIAELTKVMGITAPSLYTAFGDKKQLFLETVRLYAGDQEDMARVIGEAETAYHAARHLMTGAAVTYTGDATPKGCLLASSTASGSDASRDVQKVVADVRRGIEGRLRARIDRDVDEGILPPGTQAAPLVGLVLAVIQGMSVLARDGAPRASLLAIVDVALHAWPSTPSSEVGAS